MSAPVASKYIPGSQYAATGGTTIAEFESIQGYARSLPMPTQFTGSTDSLSLGLVVHNFSGADQAIVINDPLERNAALGNVRYNEREKEAVPLADGTGFFYPMHPLCYNITIALYTVDAKGKTVATTYLSRKMGQLEGVRIPILPGSMPGDVVVPTAVRELNDNYAQIHNLSGRDATVYVSLLNYAGSSQDVLEQKISREQDKGPQIVETKVLRHNAVWAIRRPATSVVVRALQVDNVSVGAMLVEQVPPATDYVSNAFTTARIAEVAVLFKASNTNQLVWKTYKNTTIKFVSDFLATSIPL